MVHTSQPSIGQNLMCIVYHDVKLPVRHRRHLELYLQQTFYYIRTFTEVCNLADYLNHEFIVNKLVIIVSGNEAGFICGTIENDKQSLQDPLVYEVQFDKKPLKSELSTDRKFQSIDRLIEKIDDDMKEYMINESPYDQTIEDNNELDRQQETFSFGIHDFFGKQKSFSYLNREELKFILFQSFIEVLLGIETDKEEALEQMWTSCREDPAHQNDVTCLRKIDQFAQEYPSIDPIQLYTQDSFFFRTLNKALRCEDIEKIFDFQPFLANIHQRLNNLRIEQRAETNGSEIILRRGKKLPTSTLQQLADNKDKFLSINGFLSTTKSSNAANMFAGTETNAQGHQSVLFEMHINEIIDTTRPYADISDVSTIPDEQEVLFFMGFVWRITALDKQPDDSWKVSLQLSTDMDSDLRKRFDELNKKCTFFTLGKILHELGEYKNAIHFYERMLNSTSKVSEKKTLAEIYFHMAISAYEDRSYSQALSYLTDAERLMDELTLPANDESTDLRPILAEDAPFSPMCILMNKGLVYRKKKEYKHARQSFNEALEKPGSKNDKATVLYYMGVLAFERGNYGAARNHFYEALHLATDQVLQTNTNQRLDILNKL